MQKGTALPILLVILALVGGIFGYWYLNQNSFPVNTSLKSPFQKPSKIDQFKTYTSSNLGFELQYSKDSKAFEDSEEAFNKRGNGDFRKNFSSYVGYEPGKFTGAVVVLDQKTSYDTNPLTIWVFDNDKNLSIDEWYKNFWYYPFVWGDFTYTGKTTLAPKEEATVSGQMAKSGIIDYQPGKPKFVYLSKDGKMYLFRLIGENGNKILSTFKFLDNKADETANWKTYTNEKLNFQINYPLDAKIIKPNFNTIGDTPSDVIIKFNYDKKCLEKLGKDKEIECRGDTVDIFVVSNASKTAQQLAEENKNNLKERCTVNTNNLGINNFIAFELTGCLVSGSSFYYLTGTDRHIFQIGVSDNTDSKTKQILSSFKIIKPDIINNDCKVGKDDELKDQCPQGYKCEFTGEYPDEVNGLGTCVRQ